MCLLLILLLLTPLVVPAVFAPPPAAYETFLKLHIYKGNDLVNCNRDMNPILQSLKMPCKKCNSFILGDQSYATNIKDVNEVCGSGGVHKSGNKYESKKNFRVLTCKEKTRDRKPPHCDYYEVADSKIETKKITLACVLTHPVDFPCETQK